MQCIMCGERITNNGEDYCHPCLQALAEDQADVRRDLGLDAHGDPEPDSHRTLGLRWGD